MSNSKIKKVLAVDDDQLIREFMDENLTKENLKKMQKQRVLQDIIRYCFWDLNFTDKDITEIVDSNNFKRKSFLFDKILLNSTNLFIALKIFTKNDLKMLIEKFVVPEFNYDYISRRKNIVEVFFFDKPLLIDELKWSV